MKISELQALSIEELSKMNKQQLQSILNTAGKYGTKRVERLKANKRDTPALTALKNKRIKFSYSQKNTRNELLSKTIQLQTFLNSKTSTITGAKKVEKKFLKSVGAENKPLTKNQTKKFWKMYRKYSENHANRVSNRGSTPTQRELYEAIQKGISKKQSYADIFAKFELEQKKQYEKNQQAKRDFKNGTISDFFK